ncbi:MAG TPA: hypothetical protein VMV86_02145 [Methanosarcinales archaeon]|jgi:hypothetical protein|nr:hypothetical protein [Methanosarcinales archaeon]
MQFSSFKALISFIQKQFYLDYSEAFSVAYELVVTNQILWDFGFNSYYWPSILGEEDLYEVLDISLEKETAPF